MANRRQGAVTVRPAISPRAVRRFVSFPHQIYRRDPAWVAPLRSETIKRLHPAHNPFYAGARRELFLASRDGVVVGTVAAIVDDARSSVVGSTTGCFGFFETVDDPAVSAALLEAAAEWLVNAGAVTLRGPMNGSSSDEIGVLIDGFKTRPALWQGHHLPYYRRHLEGLGLTKFDDVLAYELTSADIGGTMDNLPRFMHHSADRARSSGATLRSPTRHSWSRDIAIVHRLYVQSHRTIPGHGGMSFEQFHSIAEALRPVVDLDLTVIVEIAGEPVGFAIALPEVNEALARGGRARPWRAVMVPWHLRRVGSVSVKLLGILTEHRGRGLAMLICMELSRRILDKGYQRCEMSLVSERNTAMTSLLDGVGARVYRRYRVYETPLPWRKGIQLESGG